MLCPSRELLEGAHRLRDCERLVGAIAARDRSVDERVRDGLALGELGVEELEGAWVEMIHGVSRGQDGTCRRRYHRPVRRRRVGARWQVRAMVHQLEYFSAQRAGVNAIVRRVDHEVVGWISVDADGLQQARPRGGDPLPRGRETVEALSDFLDVQHKGSLR